MGAGPTAITSIDAELGLFALPGELDTPVAVVDLDRLDANLVRMHDDLASLGVALRPHLKTAKSVRVARRAIDAGAIGITVATLGEAEVFASAGVGPILLAYPLLAIGAKAARLRALVDRAELTVGIDSVVGARSLASAVAGAGAPLSTLIEVDCGEHRTGVSPELAGELAAAAQALGLRVRGAFTHGGHSYAGPGAVDAAAQDEVDALRAAAASLRAAGVEPEVLSAGSTPTARRSAKPPVTEERPGTFVYGDRQQANLGAVGTDEVALVVAATVVSTAVAGQIVLDAGAKALAKDRPAWLAGHGVIPALPGAVVTSVHDHHATVILAEGAQPPQVGSQVAVVPNHACPVVNLQESVLVVRNGAVVDRWAVDTRCRF